MRTTLARRRTPDRRSVWTFIAGVLTVNSIGHLATAAAGKEQLTPLAGHRSGPVVNAVWGTMNLAGGLVAARHAASSSPRWGAEVHSFDTGVAVFALWLAVSERVLGINTDRS